MPSVLMYVLLGLLTFGTVLVFEIPDTPDDALQASKPCACPQSCGWVSGGVYHSAQLEIPEEEFASSMGSMTMRSGTVFVRSPAGLVDPGDGNVQLLAKEILRTSGDSDYDRACAALSLVQNSVSYAEDTVLYGCTEFWAKPPETLYLGRGDCEDTAVLLCSLLKAMGLDCVLLDYEGHMAAGVLLDQPHGNCYALGDRFCCYCETTYPTALGEMPSRYAGEPVTVWEIGDSGLLRESLNSFCMGYRLSIQRIFGI